MMRLKIAMFATAGLLLTGCANAIEGRPVAAEQTGPVAGDDSQCETVDAPMTEIDPAPRGADDSEPIMRIPQPQGWDRITQLDSEMIRFSMRNAALGLPTFAAAAVVTVESHPGEIDANEFFDQSRDALAQAFGGDGMTYEDGTLCGLPAQTIQYTLPPQMADTPTVPATALMVVAFNGGRTYGVALTIQSPTPDNPDFKRDSENIQRGFQVLATGAGG
jgi:hypothetical protein